MSDHVCRSCGITYRSHLDLHGTCAALLKAQRERDEAHAEIVRLESVDVSARRDCAERAGIQDPTDSTACLEDFVDAITELRRERDEARAEVARLQNALEVERGEGEPPPGGWAASAWANGEVVWYRPHPGATGCYVRLTPGGWLASTQPEGRSIEFGTTAYEAMEAANATLSEPK